jgi:hypothetical protein
MTKRPTTRTPREPLSIIGKPIPKEVDFDLLGDLDDEEQGQIRPFMDPTGNPLASTNAPSSPPLPPLPDDVMQMVFKMKAEAKKKGPSHSKHWTLNAPTGSPNTLFNKTSDTKD